MKLHERYPGIAKATFLIALDNGGINRFRSEKQQRKELDSFLFRQEIDLRPIDDWLNGLPDDDLERACFGEQSEIDAFLAANAPPFTGQLLDDYFDQVC